MSLKELLLNLTEWRDFGSLWLPVGFKVVMSIVCGGIIGLEREMKHKPAGLRTNILICLGATLYTSLSLIIASKMVQNGGMFGDPGRIAAQIVTGIGFLGGGMIIQSGGGISGLTSAATVWVVAAIGLCIGLGYPIIAFTFTITVFFTLFVLSKVDHKVFGKVRSYESLITIHSHDVKARAAVMEVFQFVDLDLERLLVSESESGCQILAKYYCSEIRHLRIQASLWSIPAVERVDVKIL